MGAALSSHELADSTHFQLLSEYIDHSRKTADECAQIFRGALGAYDDDEPAGAAPPRIATRKPAYPRHLQSAQFEEVFGMLLSDPEPHFRFFQEKKSSSTAGKADSIATVCAHRVFCALALLMKADLHAKIDFVLRLYADVTGSLTIEAKSSLLNDFVTAVDLVLQLSDPIPSDVLTAIEKSFWSDDPEQLLTVWELYSVCLTNPRISGLLHDIHALVDNFSFSYRRERLHQRENLRLSQFSSVSSGSNSSPRMKSLARSMSSIALPRDSLLWELKIGDYGQFWQQTEPLEILSDVTCAHALEKMSRAQATSALVIECVCTAHTETRQYLGLITTEKLLSYFLHFLVPDLHSMACKPYKHTREHAEDAIRRFGSAPILDLVHFFVTDRAPLLCSVRDDEAFFSVLARFACGENTLAVVQDYRSVPEAVLGRLTVLDILTWLEEDLTLLRGKERSRASAFPEFFYAPATIDASAASASVCEAFIELERRQLSGMLVAADESKDSEEKVLSADAFRDLFPPTFAGLSANNSDPGPLLCALSDSTTVMPSVCMVSPDTSISRVIREMVDRRTRRVVIQRGDGVCVGAVRATDVLLLLLRAQHTSHRPRG